MTRCMLFRRAHHPAFADFALADFELRFDQRDHRTICGNERTHFGQNQFERYERCIDGREFRNERQTRRLEIADVGLLENHDARIVAQFPIELAVANIDGEHFAPRHGRADSR